MISDASRRVNMRHVANTGAALAATLLPLAAAVVLAKTMAGDPLAPVNALITTGGQRARISPSVWRRCGRATLSEWKGEWKGETPARTRCGRSVPRRPWRRSVERLRTPAVLGASGAATAEEQGESRADAGQSR
ncbi:hypothetical protein [Streptomyces sp. CB03234]|uniref:hypothetical protein n=1 Tax=Streptomyces sp. (strain CB03234) TaxID=1703937 RepID=UPI001F5247BA|nr:hypothetical protein [Streptomyces sp. CB03234]